MTKQELEMIRTTPVGGVFRYKGCNYEVQHDWRNELCMRCSFGTRAFGTDEQCYDHNMYDACDMHLRSDHKGVIFIQTTKPVSTPKRGLWKRIVELIKR